MKKLMFCLLLVGISTAVWAQKDETFFNKNGLRLTGAWGGWNNGITSFQDDYAVLVGGFGGLEFGKNLFVGYAGYHTSEEVRFNIDNPDNLDLNYSGLMVGYAPKAYKVVHPTFELLIGGGSVELEQEGKDNIFVIQPAVGVEFNIARWFRLGINGGYRIVNETDLVGVADQDLSQLYGELRFKFGLSWGTKSWGNDDND